MTKTTRTTPAAKTLLADIGFVLAMTQKVKESMGNRPTPPAASVPARVAARKQLVVAA
jgi:hypothetical protein